MERLTVAYFVIAILEGTVFDVTSGICRELSQNPSILRENEGKIALSVSSTGEECTWKLPSTTSNDHALILYVRSIEMKTRAGNRCTGSLSLPHIGSSCRHSPTCRIYVHQNSSCRISNISPNSYRGCTKSVVYFDDRPQKEVKFRSEKQGEKSFTLLYKYIDCGKTLKDQRVLGESQRQVHQTTSYSNSFTNKIESTTQKNSSGFTNEKLEKQGDLFKPTFAAIVSIIVILAILLSATCIMLFLMYKRKEKANTFQNPAVVAYVHDRTDEDGFSSTQITPEYLEFPTPTGVGSESPEEPKNLYAEIGRDAVSSDEFFTVNVRSRHYENIDETQSNHTASTGHIDLDLEELPTSYTYATVNKIRNPHPDVSL
uniref:uncharacterized protein LOC120346449 n=1 Tax=Styela clava TaxID=7725 RepID=UPI001939468D|nr:uncharacterized protein LOC120346449 [Styela clava]